MAINLSGGVWIIFQDVHSIGMFHVKHQWEPDALCYIKNCQELTGPGKYR